MCNWSYYVCVSVSVSYPKRNLSYSNNHFATKKKIFKKP